MQGVRKATEKNGERLEYMQQEMYMKDDWWDLIGREQAIEKLSYKSRLVEKVRSGVVIRIQVTGAYKDGISLKK